MPMYYQNWISCEGRLLSSHIEFRYQNGTVLITIISQADGTHFFYQELAETAQWFFYSCHYLDKSLTGFGYFHSSCEFLGKLYCKMNDSKVRLIKRKKYRIAGHRIFGKLLVWLPYWDAGMQCGKKTKDKKKAQNFFPCPYFRLPEGAILKLKLLVIENLSF